jgi:hypothetical protein
MVSNATFNNISVISWPSILLVEQPEYPEKTTDLLQVTDKLKSLDLLKDHNSWSFLYTLSLEAHYM